jgi:hypothetical protein
VAPPMTIRWFMRGENTFFGLWSLVFSRYAPRVDK